MSTPLVINGTTFQIPDQGQSPPWGDDLHDLLVGITNSLNSVVGSADILTTSFNLTNNQASVANVTGAAFDTSQVRSFVLNYSIYISTSANELSEAGTLYGTYKSTANTWDLSQTYGGSSGVVFTITNAGQIQYTTTNVLGTTYVGKLKFKAQAFLQA